VHAQIDYAAAMIIKPNYAAKRMTTLSTSLVLQSNSNEFRIAHNVAARDLFGVKRRQSLAGLFSIAA